MRKKDFEITFGRHPGLDDWCMCRLLRSLLGGGASVDDQEPKRISCGDVSLEVFPEDRHHLPSGFYLPKVAGNSLNIMPCRVSNDPRTEFLSDVLKRERELRRDAEAGLKKANERWNNLQAILNDDATT